MNAPTPTLYQLTGQWLELANQLADMDLDPQTIADTLEASDEQTALEEKAQGYEMVARTIESAIPAIDTEVKRLQELKEARKRRAAVLRERLLAAMQALEIQKITCPLFEMSRRKNPAKVVIDDEAAIPFEYWRKPEVEIVVDKELLKAALKDGKEISGARLECAERLQVK